MPTPDVRTEPARFTAALDALVARVREDRSILAAILCGSLSHDTVWEKSDIDLVFVTIDDRKVKSSDVALYADGVNVHALLVPRAEFRKSAEGAIRNSFVHSLYAKGRLLYTHDDTIARLFAELRELGSRDTRLQMLRAGTAALPALYKAHKWLRTRGDLDYSALWILIAAGALARVEVLSAGLVADREVLPQAMTLNPEFFRIVYSDLLNEKKTERKVRAALQAIDAFIAARAPTLFSMVIEHLNEVGETRSCTEIEDYFRRTFGLEGVTTTCEYLADQGLIGKASVSTQLTPRSTVEVQELAFYYMSNSANAG